MGTFSKKYILEYLMAISVVDCQFVSYLINFCHMWLRKWPIKVRYQRARAAAYVVTIDQEVGHKYWGRSLMILILGYTPMTPYKGGITPYTFGLPC